MKNNTTTQSRRTFLKATALTGGGMILGIHWLSGATTTPAASGLDLVKDTYVFNGHNKITSDNIIQIMSQNPEFGQNVKTSLPMIVAEELDADWKNVVVEQAPFDLKLYTRQFAGGSQSVKTTWTALRTAGATARQMLREATAQFWNVPLEEVTPKQVFCTTAKVIKR